MTTTMTALKIGGKFEFRLSNFRDGMHHYIDVDVWLQDLHVDS